jgi:hypothetical protein
MACEAPAESMHTSCNTYWNLGTTVHLWVLATTVSSPEGCSCWQAELFDKI